MLTILSLYGGGICAALAFFALLYAPYLPRLVLEGYPQADWPAPGDFTTVAGSAQADPIPSDMSGAAFDPKGRRLFEEKEGRCSSFRAASCASSTTPKLSIRRLASTPIR